MARSVTQIKSCTDLKYIYGDDLVKIVNLKQILFYTKHGIQPVFIEEGFKGKLVAWFCKSDTTSAWELWLNSPQKEIKKKEEYI